MDPTAKLMSTNPKPAAVPAAVPGPETVGDEVLTELIRRLQDIEGGHRALAEKMGQLYIYADQHDLASLTRSLDRPMRHASESERALAAILDALKLRSIRRQQRKT